MRQAGRDPVFLSSGKIWSGCFQTGCSNGFTLTETLLSLLIVSILGLLTLEIHQGPSLAVFIKNMQVCIESEQLRAFIHKERREIQILEQGLKTEDTTVTYPDGIVCTGCTFTFNPRGNISQANTVLCRQGNREMALILQLGSGSVRVEDRENGYGHGR